MTQPSFLIRSAVLAGLVALPSLASAETIQLTLEEALARAETMNVDVLIGRESVQQALEAKARARGALLPSVDLGASQTRSRAGGETTDRFNASLSGRLALLDAQRIANYSVQKVGEEAARTTFAQGVQTVLDTVSTLYFNHLRNLRRLELNKANIERAEVLLRLARSQLSAGVATQIDVTRAEAQLANQEQARLQQETVTYNSELLLKRALDLPEDADLTITEFNVMRSLDPSLLSLNAGQVLDKRLDYIATSKQLEQNKLEIRAARYQRAPVVSLSAGIGYGAETLFDDDWNNSWNVGISASVPLFDGFQIESNSRLARSRTRATEIRLNNLQRVIGDEIRFALRNTQSRLSQIEVAEKNASLAAEELRLARIRFEQGVADNREVVDAQNNLATANDNLVDAFLQYHLARVELARVRGDVRLILQEQG